MSAATDDMPASGDGCLCCRNRGVLPAAEVNSKPVGIPGMVDGATILKCCAQCIEALFFGGSHPHTLDVAGIVGGDR